MKHPSEYLEKVTMEHRRERVPNDYRTKDDKPNYYGEPMTKEEENEYLDLLLTREEQGLPNYF